MAVRSTKFDGEWFFLKDETGETLACLKQPDVMKLREIMVRCNNGSD